MAPSIGIWASSLFANSGSFESIQTVTVGAGGASSISFTSIPQTYKHLQIRGVCRSTWATAADQDLKMNFNADAASDYSEHYLYGSGTAAGASNFNSSYTALGTIPGDGFAASIFGVAIADILDYTNTNKYKTTRVLSGFDSNGGGFVYLYSGNWRSSSAITQIDLTPTTGNFKQYSSFALYGSKG